MAGQSELPKWGELAEIVATKLELGQAKSPTLKTIIERGVRYIRVDDEARQLVFDTRALFIGLIAAGQTDRDSIRYGNTASWFFEWLRGRIGPQPVDQILTTQLGDQDKIFGGLNRGYQVGLSRSVRGLIEPAKGIARTTIETPEYEARHLFGAMMLQGSIEKQVRKLYSLELGPGDIGDLARILVDRIMTSPQPKETKENWIQALAPLYDRPSASSNGTSRIDELLKEHGIGAATGLAARALELACRLNQSDGDVVEISSSRLFVGVMQLVQAVFRRGIRTPFQGLSASKRDPCNGRCFTLPPV